MGAVQLMHAGEEGLIILIPLAIVLYVDYRQRRKEKRAAAAAAANPAARSAKTASDTDSAPD